MHLLVIGDVGSRAGVRHVGDEAMLESLIEQMRRRGCDDFTVVSANPTETAALYGVKAVDRPGIAPGAGEAAWTERVDEILAAAEGDGSRLAPHDGAWELVHATAACDAVVISGGGNLSSMWPEMVVERHLMSRLARVFSKPLIVSGQTIGPTLLDTDGRLVQEILVNADLVGLREQESYTLVVDSLGVPADRVRRTVDDAAFLGSPDPDNLAMWLPRDPYCLATFAPHIGTAEIGNLVTSLAALLDLVSERFHVEVVFLPHEGSPDDPTLGDGAVHVRIAEQMNAPHRLLPTLSNRLSAELARRATLSVSTRYHPAVFAAGAGVPAMVLAVDEYTDVKLSGALWWFGQADLAFPIPSLLVGDVALAAAELHASLGNYRSSFSALADRRAIESAGWWDEMFALVAGESKPAPHREISDCDQVEVLGDDLRQRVQALSAWLRNTSRLFAHGTLASRDLEATIAHAAAAESERETEREREVGRLAADLDDALRDIAHTSLALRQAHDQSGEIEDRMRVDAEALRRELAAANASRAQSETERAACQAALDRLVNTRSIRWLRFPRAIYGRARRF